MLGQQAVLLELQKQRNRRTPLSTMPDNNSSHPTQGASESMKELGKDLLQSIAPAAMRRISG
jgi:hypothetical protein